MKGISRLACSAALAATAMFGGCAQFTHYNARKTLAARPDAATVAFIDAKQRTVTAMVQTEPVTLRRNAQSALEWDPGGPRTTVRLCAEPSPDALSALAASQGLSFSNPGGTSVDQAFSLAEAAGSIGLRTQSIQLMRDAMYRICEGYQSGALSNGAFETLHRRLQSSMVGILAIEQLTGTVKAQQVLLGGSAGTGAAAAIESLTRSTSAAAETLAGAERTRDAAVADRDTLQKQLEALPAGTEQATVDGARAKVAAQGEVVQKAEAEVKRAREAYEAIDAGRRAALTGTTSVTGSASAVAVTGGSAPTGAELASIAASVQAIVNETLGLQFSNELCTTVLVASTYGEAVADIEVSKGCYGLLHASRAALDADTRLVNAAASLIEQGLPIPPELARALETRSTRPLTPLGPGG